MIDTSCASYRAMLDAATAEAMSMIALGRDQIQGANWQAPGTAFGDALGSLFPTALSASDKNAIQSRLFLQANFLIIPLISQH
jgi:hypothetical protein